MRWYHQPVALLGSLSVAYHEVLRGRRTGICENCGRLNHAEAEKCLCGGPVEPIGEPGEFIDDPKVAEYDTLSKPGHKATVYSLQLLIILSIVMAIYYTSMNGWPRASAVIGLVAMIWGDKGGIRVP